MAGKWGICGALAMTLGIVAGCKTPPPNVKPADQPEVLQPAPSEARFNQPGMPKDAFTRDDPMKRWNEILKDSSIGAPSASMSGPGGPGMRR